MYAYSPTVSTFLFFKYSSEWVTRVDPAPLFLLFSLTMRFPNQAILP